MGNRNRNREAGDYFERRTRDALEADGWVVVRSAGSLGPADLVALRFDAMPRLLSCKVHGKMTRSEARDLVECASQAAAIPILARRDKPGWVAMFRVDPLPEKAGHELVQVDSLHMPPRRRNAPRTDGLYPLGTQMELPFAEPE